MKRFLKLTGTFVVLAILSIVAIVLLMPWMDRWGATDDEIAASFPGDELVPSPAISYNRAVTVNAAPEEIYPWIVQLGADRGGYYTYSWFETNILQCELINADRIHEEWQDLKVGDQVKMCPGESGPRPWDVAVLEPNHAVVLGHKRSSPVDYEDGQWSDVWQFILLPQSDGTTRLVLRSRDMKTGGFWDIIRPGVFIMERGMLLGIKERAEATELSALTLVTPTPEVFHPLDPSPTPSNSTLPLTCQVTDLNVHIDSTAGYCFAYPKRFTFGTQPFFNMPAVMGPAIGSSDEPVFATFAVEVTPHDSAKGLDQQVDEFLRGFTAVAPESITRARVVVGGEAAVQVDNVPVQLSWRIVFVPHEGQLYRLMYWPVDVPEAKADIDELYQTTLNSFAFLSEDMQTVSWSEFGKTISLSYDPILSSPVETETVPAIPASDQILFAEAHPAFAQFRFPEFQGGRLYDLPLVLSENRIAQVMVFRTADFPGFGDDNPQGFVGQLQALVDLLQTGVEPARCTQPFIGYDLALPFLPWVNAQQSFCAQPQIIEFSGGKGVRYLTYYTQGPGPALDHQIFYTFQGLTEDGQFYVSAFFPVQTGIFPTEPSPCSKCGEPDYDPFTEWRSVLTEQLAQLNAQPAGDFAPSLILLDDLVQSIHIGQ